MPARVDSGETVAAVYDALIAANEDVPSRQSLHGYAGVAGERPIVIGGVLPTPGTHLGD